MNATAAALAVQGLDVRLGHGAHARVALQGVSLAVPQAAWTSVVGPNGAGKSTLLRALAGLVPPSAGSVYLLGRPLAQWARRERAQALAWLGQGEATPDDLTVYDVALLGRLPHQPWLAPPTLADHAAVAQALQATGAWHWRARTLGQLSGGERQRVLLARALAVQAQVLLMDEPLTHLDPPHQADWLQLVRALVAQGTTVVSVLHEVSVALQADHIAVLAAGRVLHHGPSSASAAHRAVEQVFDHRIAIHAVAGQWVALPHIHQPFTK